MKNAFHSSGSSTLQYNKDVLKFFENHLIDVINNEVDNNFEIIFDINPPVFVIDELEPYGLVSVIGNVIKFINVYNVPNEDVGKTIDEIDKALRTEKSPIPIKDNYTKIINGLLAVNNIYSVLLEVILCNLYVDENDIVYRYQSASRRKISKKYSVYHVSTMISPLLAMLYTPNNITMSNLELDLNKNLDDYSILEKLWLQTK